LHRSIFFDEFFSFMQLCFLVCYLLRAGHGLNHLSREPQGENAMNPTLKRLRRVFLALAAFALSVPGAAYAVSITLGDQDFADGALVSNVAAFSAPQVGEPAPFGLFLGSDVGTGNFSASWTFNYGAGAVTSASIAFGIFDHDSAATGNQLVSYSVDGIDLTAALNALFEAPGVGTQDEVNVFTLALSGAALAALADGSATFSLSLQAPALCGAPGTTADCSPVEGNGAGLDFSTLDFTQAQVVSEPATLALLGIALAGLGFRRRTRSS
jgi:hypothetical protein